MQKSQGGAVGAGEESQGDICAELKDFIVRENAKCVEAIRDSNERRMAAMEEAVSFAMDSISNIAARQQSADADILQLRRENQEMLSRLRHLEMQEDRLQQERRMTCLLFSGPVIQRQNRHEEAAGLVYRLIRQHMQYDLDRSQLKTAFRLKSGKIMAEFSSAASGSDRDVLFRTKSKLKGSGLFISESLTPRRHAMYMDLLQLKRERVIFSVFTRSGNVMVCKSRDSAPIRVADPGTVRQLSESSESGPVGRGRFRAGEDGRPPGRSSGVPVPGRPRAGVMMPPAVGAGGQEPELLSPRGVTGSSQLDSPTGSQGRGNVGVRDGPRGGVRDVRSRQPSSSLLDCAREPVRQVRLMTPLSAPPGGSSPGRGVAVTPGSSVAAGDGPAGARPRLSGEGGLEPPSQATSEAALDVPPPGDHAEQDGSAGEADCVQPPGEDQRNLSLSQPTIGGDSAGGHHQGGRGSEGGSGMREGSETVSKVTVQGQRDTRLVTQPVCTSAKVSGKIGDMSDSCRSSRGRPVGSRDIRDFF